jgi:phenylalanyl-tRNA synthetase beta chain
MDKVTFDRKYKGVAKYPAVNRDLSLVMKKEIFIGQVEKVMRDKGGKLLESIKLFDVYEGSQITPGYKSVAFSLTFRSPERSLESGEVNKIVDKILEELEKMGIQIRS